MSEEEKLKNEELLKENEELLKEFYKENQKFIDKAIFTVSSASVPLLANFYDKIEGFYSGVFLLMSLLFFIVVILVQLSAFHFGKKSCDLFLSKDPKKHSEAENKRKKSVFLDQVVLWIFCLALVFVFLMLTTNVIKKMANDNQSNSKIFNNSLNIPESRSQQIRYEETKSLNIPSSLAQQILAAQPSNSSSEKPVDKNEKSDK